MRTVRTFKPMHVFQVIWFVSCVAPRGFFWRCEEAVLEVESERQQPPEPHELLKLHL